MIERWRDSAAAGKLLSKQGFAPAVATIDKLQSNGGAFAGSGLTARHERGLRQSDRAEVRHQPVRRRERKMQRSRRLAPPSASSPSMPTPYDTSAQRHVIARRTLRIFCTEATAHRHAAAAA